MSSVILIQNFVENVTKHCRDNRISWAELSRRTAEFTADEKPIHVVTISRIMNGHHVPGVDACEVIARAAGIRPDTAFLQPDENLAKRA